MKELFANSVILSGAKNLSKTHPNHLSQTILNRLLGRVLQKVESRKAAFTLAEVFSPCRKVKLNFGFTLAEVFSPCRKVKLNFGFTLAEVLITLGILGIIAALTLPSVVTKYQKKQTVVRLQKVYSILKQATEFAVREYGDVENWDYTLSEYDFGQKYYKPYLKVIVDRKRISYSWSDLGGTQYSGNVPALVLSDGTNIFFDFTVPFQARYMIIVDINGKRGPNKAGRDVFAFSIYNNALHTYNQYKDELGVKAYMKRESVIYKGTSGQCNKESSGGIIGAGSYCSRLIELDSWQIKEDYPW